MTRGSSVLGGAAAGLGGALAGHWAILLLQRATGDAEVWLKGAHGPPFFELVLATAIFYACAAAGGGSGGPRPRLRRAAASAGAGFLALALPMMIATRCFRWGEDSPDPSWAWVYLVFACYGAANAAACWAAGWAERPGSWKSGVWTLAAGGAAWLVDRVLQWPLSKVTGPVALPGPLPPPPAMLSGLVWGGALGLGLAAIHRSAGTGRAS